MRQFMVSMTIAAVLFFGIITFLSPNSDSPAPQAVKPADVPPGMEQSVVFSHRFDFGDDVDALQLQEAINAWLRENYDKVEIVRILQSQSGDTNKRVVVTTTIFYKKLDSKPRAE